MRRVEIGDEAVWEFVKITNVEQINREFETLFFSEEAPSFFEKCKDSFVVDATVLASLRSVFALYKLAESTDNLVNKIMLLTAAIQLRLKFILPKLYKEDKGTSNLAQTLFYVTHLQALLYYQLGEAWKKLDEQHFSPGKHIDLKSVLSNHTLIDEEGNPRSIVKSAIKFLASNQPPNLLRGAHQNFLYARNTYLFFATFCFDSIKRTATDLAFFEACNELLQKFKNNNEQKPITRYVLIESACFSVERVFIKRLGYPKNFRTADSVNLDGLKSLLCLGVLLDSGSKSLFESISKEVGCGDYLKVLLRKDLATLKRVYNYRPNKAQISYRLGRLQGELRPLPVNKDAADRDMGSKNGPLLGANDPCMGISDNPGQFFKTKPSDEVMRAPSPPSFEPTSMEKPYSMLGVIDDSSDGNKVVPPAKRSRLMPASSPTPRSSDFFRTVHDRNREQEFPLPGCLPLGHPRDDEILGFSDHDASITTSESGTDAPGTSDTDAENNVTLTP